MHIHFNAFFLFFSNTKRRPLEFAGSPILNIPQSGVASDGLFDVKHSARLNTINNIRSSSGSSIWLFNLKGVHASKRKTRFLSLLSQHCVAASGANFFFVFSKYHFPYRQQTGPSDGLRLE